MDTFVHCISFSRISDVLILYIAFVNVLILVLVFFFSFLINLLIDLFFSNLF